MENEYCCFGISVPEIHRKRGRRFLNSQNFEKSKSKVVRKTMQISQQYMRNQTVDPDVAVVMPCYNEANRLDIQHIVSFIAKNPNILLILVNDGSDDTTLNLLHSMAQSLPNQITVLDLLKNRGKAEAVRQGLMYAETMSTPLVAYWDADLATPLDAILDFVIVANRYPELQGVFGSRRQLLGHRIHRTISRKVISGACAFMARLVLGMQISDTQCGAKLFRKSLFLREALETPFTAGWLFDVELFARIGANVKSKTQAFYEFPLSQWDEISGSKVTNRAIVRASIEMLRLIAVHRFGIARSVAFDVASNDKESALLHKSPDCRTSPIPG